MAVLDDEVVPEPAPRRCRARWCEEPAATGAKWCEGHGATFARLRDELAAEKRVFQSRVGREGVPTCCAPGCWEPRERGRRYCPDCEGAGWDEDSLE